MLCISDEVYEHQVFEGEHRSPAEFSETGNVVIVNACSKAYSMTGWRLGWVTGSTDRIERMLRVHQYAQACASAPAQFAAEAALTGPQGIVDEMTDSFQRRRDRRSMASRIWDWTVRRPRARSTRCRRSPTDG